MFQAFQPSIADSPETAFYPPVRSKTPHPSPTFAANPEKERR